MIDHHIDTHAYDDQLVEKQIELIGSAATLVYDRLLKEFPGSIDPELAHFLKAPIVLDSYYFEPSLKESKWTDKDLSIFNILTEIQGSTEEENKAQFERLFTAITDVELNLKLGMGNLLIKDFKTYYLLGPDRGGIGIGTIHVPIAVMIERFGIDGVAGTIRQLIKERSLAYYGILTNCRDSATGDYKKEVLLLTNNPESDSFADFVHQLHTHEGFQLHDRQDLVHEGSTIVSWKVGNTKYSRKDVEKVMTAFYAQTKL